VVVNEIQAALRLWFGLSMRPEHAFKVKGDGQFGGLP
jgi:hypothetical protein